MSKILLGFTQAIGEFVKLALEVGGVDHGVPCLNLIQVQQWGFDWGNSKDFKLDWVSFEKQL